MGLQRMAPVATLLWTLLARDASAGGPQATTPNVGSTPSMRAPPATSAHGDSVAAEYSRLDEAVSAAFPRSTTTCAFAEYAHNAERVVAYDKTLEQLATKHGSVEFSAVTLARRGSLWDWLRQTVYFCTGRSFRLLTPQQEQRVAAMRQSSDPAMKDLADDLEAKWKEAGRRERAQKLEAAEAAMVTDYAQAIVLADVHHLRDPEIVRARRRLADNAVLIGDANMAAYVARTPDPFDPKSHLTYTPGMYALRP